MRNVQAAWLYCVLLKPNLQLSFANANLIDAGQTRTLCRHLQANCQISTHMCIHACPVPLALTSIIARRCVHIPTLFLLLLLLLLTLQWRLPLQLQARVHTRYRTITAPRQ